MTKQQALLRVPFLQQLDAAQRQRLAGRVQLCELAKGEQLWRAGAPCQELYVCVSGRLKLVSCGDPCTILDICEAGELLCVHGQWRAQSYCCRAVAMKDGTRALRIPLAALFSALEESPALLLPLLGAIGERGMAMCHRLTEVAPGNVERRIVLLLSRLADSLGEARGPGVWIPLALSRLELANLCGTTTETATRVMTRLRRENVVAVSRGGFFVPDLATLERRSRGPLRSCAPRR